MEYDESKRKYGGKIMLFDSHAHMNNESFDEEEREALIAKIEASKVDYVMDIGFNPESSELAVKHANRLSWCYAAVGCHPHDTKDMDEEKLDRLRELAQEEKKQKRNHGKGWRNESLKVKRLLFRLVNRIQPGTIIDFGTPSSSSLYLQSGKATADYTFASELSELFLEADVPVDFLYIHCHQSPVLVEDVFRICLARVVQQSVFVIRGIHYSKAMKNLWERLKADDRVGITFDLYDVGILFFDKTKIKQHYIVNF